MIVKDFVSHLEKLAPKHLAESWDNVGLLIGEENADVTGVLFTLDVTDNVLDEAIMCGANLIISHHPPLFKGIQTIVDSNLQQKLYIKAIRNGINLYAAHTNLDVVENGMNDWLAQALKLENIDILHVDGVRSDGQPYGIGRVGDLLQDMSLSEFVTYVADNFNVNGIRYVGDEKRIVKRVAVLGGAGQSYYKDAFSKGADVFITGDVTYHVAQEMLDAGLMVVDPGHYIEVIVVEQLRKYYQDYAKDYNIPLYKTTVNTNPFKFRK